MTRHEKDIHHKDTKNTKKNNMHRCLEGSRFGARRTIGDVGFTAHATERLAKQAAPGKDPAIGSSTGRSSINNAEERSRSTKHHRWVIRGSRLFSHVPVALALRGTREGERNPYQSGSPPGRLFFALFVPFRLRQAFGATGFAAILVSTRAGRSLDRSGSRAKRAPRRREKRLIPIPR